MFTHHKVWDQQVSVFELKENICRSLEKDIKEFESRQSPFEKIFMYAQTFYGEKGYRNRKNFLLQLKNSEIDSIPKILNLVESSEFRGGAKQTYAIRKAVVKTFGFTRQHIEIQMQRIAAKSFQSEYYIDNFFYTTPTYKKHEDIEGYKKAIHSIYNKINKSGDYGRYLFILLDKQLVKVANDTVLEPLENMDEESLQLLQSIKNDIHNKLAVGIKEYESSSSWLSKPFHFNQCGKEGYKRRKDFLRDLGKVKSFRELFELIQLPKYMHGNKQPVILYESVLRGFDVTKQDILAIIKQLDPGTTINVENLEKHKKYSEAVKLKFSERANAYAAILNRRVSLSEEPRQQPLASAVGPK
jgi:hypothetical protein